MAISSRLIYLVELFAKVTHGYQLYLSTRILLTSYRAITNLRVHEPETKTAARYSQAVADQLRSIRFTQASGAVAALFSFISAIYLLPSRSSTNTRATFIPAEILLPLLNILFSAATSQYMASFWRNSARVPLMKSYNDALDQTDAITSLLQATAVAWSLSLPVGLVPNSKL